MATVNQLVRKPRAQIAKSNVPALKHARKNVAYVLVYILPLPKNRTPRCKSMPCSSDYLLSFEVTLPSVSEGHNLQETLRDPDPWQSC